MFFYHETESQSKSSIISDAFVKSHGFFMHYLVILNDISLWSELTSGGITEQFSTKPLFDTKARSIKVALQLVATRVDPSCTR